MNTENEMSGSGEQVSWGKTTQDAYKLPFDNIVINMDATTIEGLTNLLVSMIPVEGLRNPFLVVSELGGWMDNLMSRFLGIKVPGIKLTIKDQHGAYDEMVVQTSVFELFGMKFELEAYLEVQREYKWDGSYSYDDAMMVMRVGLPAISNIPDDSFNFPGGGIIRKLLSFPVNWLRPITAIGFRFGDECDGCEIPEIPELTDSQEGFSVDMTFDMTKSSGPVVEAINGFFSVLGAGSTPYEDKAALGKLFYNCSQKPTDKSFVMTMDITISTGGGDEASLGKPKKSGDDGEGASLGDGDEEEEEEEGEEEEGMSFLVCITRSCPVATHGVPMDDGGMANITSGDIEFCVEGSEDSFSIGVTVEIGMEAILPNSTHPGDKSKYTQRVEMGTEMSFEIGGPPPYIALQLAAYAKLQGSTQMWVNPFGAIPNAAIIFPLALTVGFTWEIPKTVIPGLMEMEFGIALCRGAPLEPRSLEAQKNITAANKASPIQTKDKTKAGLDEETNLQESANNLNAMLLAWKCGDADPYGESPTVVKMAAMMDVSDEDDPQFAFQMSLREISLGRLIMACMPGPIKPVTLLIMAAVRPFIDIFYIESLDISINLSPYPVEMTSGTFIPSGVLIDIRGMDFFKLIYIERAYFYFSVDPFIMEAQLYIRPFSLSLGSVELFAIRGINGEEKENADYEAEQAHLARVERANAAKALAEKHGRIKGKKILSAMHWCDQGPCYHCATVSEAESVTFSCPGTDSLIYNAKHAVWATAESLPAWSTAATPGLCQLNVTKEEATPWPDIGDGVTRAPMMNTRDFITEKCKGNVECEFTPNREGLGEPAGLEEGSALSLMVAVQCLPRAMYEELAGENGLDILNSLKCVHGCLTCASDSFEEEDDMFDFTMGCFADGIIVDVLDASYAVADDSPEFIFKPAAAACLVETVPRAESQCELNEELVINTLSKYCYGRQMCSFTKLNLQRLFPETILPECAIDKVMRISAIVKCKRNRMPLAADEMPDNNEFNFLQFEERKLAANSTTALSSAYHMRVAFQPSPDVLHFEKPDNFTKYVWGHDVRTGSGAKIARRMLATFTVPIFGSGNEIEVAFWRFKVTGVKRFAKSGGMLSIMSAGFEEDLCHNCDLNACQDSSDGGDTCTFMVHLKGGSKYTLVLYGISRIEKKGDAVTVTWKPPSNCYQKLDCVTFGDPCTEVSNDDMEWQPVKHGPWTYLVCRTSHNARLLTTNVDTKPFCLDASEFADQENCWPNSEVTDAAGTSCAGVYTAGLYKLNAVDPLLESA